MSEIHFTNHSLKRFKEHHPRASYRKLKAAFRASDKIDTKVARTMLGRSFRGGAKGDSYFLAQDRRGLFVLQKGEVITTYIRFEGVQVDMAHSLYPRAIPDEEGLSDEEKAQRLVLRVADLLRISTPSVLNATSEDVSKERLERAKVLQKKCRIFTKSPSKMNRLSSHTRRSLYDLWIRLKDRMESWYG